jgi:hypothetical protein
MKQIGKLLLSIVVCFLTASVSLQAQGGGSLSEISDHVYSQFKLVQMSADMVNVVTPGSILTLHKGGLTMIDIGSPEVPTFSYRDGRLSAGFMSQATISSARTNGTPVRTFGPGELLWINDIHVDRDSVTLFVLSDIIGDARYRGQIKFPFPGKHEIPSADQLLKTIAEVVTTDGAGAPAPAPVEKKKVALPPLPPPPPDVAPAQPKTIALGQPREVVVAIMGPPEHAYKVGANKEILRYSNHAKITLIGGKVANVE